jgi:histone H3/H4
MPSRLSQEVLIDCTTSSTFVDGLPAGFACESFDDQVIIMAERYVKGQELSEAAAAPPSLPSELSWDATAVDPLREQDRLLPVANVAHLLASVLPEGAKVSKDAKLFAQEVVSEFICFITSEANDVCTRVKQKAITQADIRTSLANLGAWEPHLRSTHQHRRSRLTKPL